ncbi:hypothetical protein BDR06DRAFT_1010224 [Suillus hirtellus]|nr:hypothetical protein BDR06DRAFT_1010224 [Suillus hirtellus]
MPSNLWIVIDNASAEAGVPGWVGDDPPLPRQVQLGDFGLGFKPSDSHKFAKLLAENPAKTCRIETSDGGGTGRLMCAGNSIIKKEHAAKLKNKPSQAMDCLLRIAFHDSAIIHGLEEMFQIFMPANLIYETYETLNAEYDFVPYVPLDDSAIGVTYEQMIEIIKCMLKEMKDKTPPSPKAIEDTYEYYQARLHHDFTSDGVEDICICQEHNASCEVCQSQHNRCHGLRDLTIPTNVQSSQSSPSPTFYIFHVFESPNSP